MEWTVALMWAQRSKRHQSGTIVKGMSLLPAAPAVVLASYKAVLVILVCLVEEIYFWRLFTDWIAP